PEDRKAEGVVPNLSVRENICLAALPRLSRAGLVTQAKQDEIVRFFMDRLRIKASGPDQRVGDLSGGNQQKGLLISSDLEELIEGSDRVVILKDGQVVGHLEGDDVTEDALLAALATAPE